jgi:hypothetical protein
MHRIPDDYHHRIHRAVVVECHLLYPAEGNLQEVYPVMSEVVRDLVVKMADLCREVC